MNYRAFAIGQNTQHDLNKISVGQSSDITLTSEARCIFSRYGQNDPKYKVENTVIRKDETLWWYVWKNIGSWWYTSSKFKAKKDFEIVIKFSADEGAYIRWVETAQKVGYKGDHQIEAYGYMIENGYL